MIKTVLSHSGVQNPAQSCKGSGVFMDRLELSILVMRIVMWIHSSFVVSESQNLLEKIEFAK